MHFMIDETLQCRVWGETRTKSEERVRVTSQTTLVVENVRRYFTPQKLKGHTHGGVKVMKRTAEATGLSLTNMKRVHSEYLAQDGEFFSPVKRYMVSRIRVNRLLWSSGHQEGCVRVYAGKEYPTLSAILKKAREDILFPGGRFCMWRVLRVGQKTIHFWTTIRNSTMTQVYLQQICKIRHDNKYIIIY